MSSETLSFAVGDRVHATALTFESDGTIVERGSAPGRGGPGYYKVKLDTPPPDLPGDTPWFNGYEVKAL